MSSSLRCSTSPASACSAPSRSLPPRRRGWRSSPTRCRSGRCFWRGRSSASGRAACKRSRSACAPSGWPMLIYPLAGNGVPLGIILALATGVSWAAGTVYLKWARIEADPMGVASWQMTIAFVVLAACMFMVEGRLGLGGMHADGAVRHRLDRHASATALPMRCGSRSCGGCPAVTASLGVLGGPGDRRRRFVSDPRRGADRHRHHRLRIDLCRIGLRACSAPAPHAGRRLRLDLLPPVRRRAPSSRFADRRAHRSR